jgi:hypothetical protein
MMRDSISEKRKDKSLPICHPLSRMTRRHLMTNLRVITSSFITITQRGNRQSRKYSLTLLKIITTYKYV